MIRLQLLLLVALLASALALTGTTGCGDDGPPSNGDDTCTGADCQEEEEEVPEDSEDLCTFNEDCVEQERCVCTLEDGCFCRFGPRGEGQSGVDTCDDGDDCATALCVEGPQDVYYCSGTCEGPDDCGPALPICSNIAFLGQVCIRDPNG